MDVLDIDSHDSLVYILITNSLKLIELFFRILYNEKCNTKNIILMTDKTNDLDGLLKLAWTNYKILNILNFQLNQKKSDMGVMEMKIDISFFDPFAAYQNSQQGIHRISIFRHAFNEKNIIHSQKIFHNRILNLREYPVRTGVINFPGYLEMVNDGDILRHTKVYGNVLNLISRYMNFKPMSIIPRDVAAYGGLLENGSVVGLIGLLEREEVEFVANVRVYEHNFLENATFSSILGETSHCFITPNKIANLKSTFTSIVGKRTYSGLTITCVIAVLLKYIHHKLHCHYAKTYKKFDLSKHFIELLAYYLLVSYKVPTNRFHKSLFIVLIFMTMVVNLTYQGNMVKILTLETKSVNLKNLRELANSNLKILMTIGTASYNPFRALGEKINEKVKARMIKVTEYDEGIDRVINNKDSAFLVLKSFIDVYGSKWYSNKTGSSLVNVISDEENMRAFLALLVIRRSPYLTRINSMVKRIREAGLYDKIYRDSVFISQLQLSRMPKPANKTSFSMEELWFIFLLLGASLTACTATFLLEIIYKKISSRKLFLTV